MCRHIAKYGVVVIALLTLGCLASSAQGLFSPFQIDYFANLDKYDGQKKVVNTGFYGDTPQAGSVCDEIYVFNKEQLLECCGCYVTPNGSRDFSVNTNFLSNTLTGVKPKEVVVKQLATGPLGASSDFSCSFGPDGTASCGGSCNPTNTAPTVVRGGALLAWAIKAQVIGSLTGITETASQPAVLGAGELADLGEDCAVAIELGTGSGICNCGGFN